jgi:membrane-associated phospholipid phosphatase
MMFWTLITAIGDAGLMVPGALILIVGLFAAKAEPPAKVWLTLLMFAAALVATTKIAFIGWGIGIHRFDFTGISGHSTLSMAVIPVAFFLLAGESDKVRLICFAFGVLLAALIAYSRVILHMHSPSEAIAGTLLGLCVSLGFVYRARGTPIAFRLANMPLLSVSLLALFLFGYGKQAPSEYMLAKVALFLSGHERPMTRKEWWAEGWRKVGRSGPPSAQNP